MGKVYSEISMSLDGCVTGPNVRIGNGMGGRWDRSPGLPAPCLEQYVRFGQDGLNGAAAECMPQHAPEHRFAPQRSEDP
jgi:hypothetical protein